MAKIDLTGRTFGRLTVLHETVKTSTRRRWLCACECGNETTVDQANLTTGNSTSCGCARLETNCKVRVGDTYGRLTVVQKTESKSFGKSTMSSWLCKCTCGSEHTVLGMSLRNGDTKSCGCLLSESSSNRAANTIADLTGREFGLLVVAARASAPRTVRNVKWLCACQCGNLTIVSGGSLTGGNTISCGCKKYSGERLRPENVVLKHRVYHARRRAAKRRAHLPFDAELFELVETEAYELSQRRTRIFGFEWNVDHIVPLTARVVCGLHSEYNLAVIPAIENSKKRNLYWPDMP